MPVRGIRPGAGGAALRVGPLREDLMPGALEYGLLGPLRVRRGSASVPVPAGQQRVLLAALLLRAGRPASVDELAELLWGDAPPPGLRLGVQNCVMRLRKSLGAAVIVTAADGYLIQAGAGELDVTRFESALAAGRAAARAGDWAGAAVVLSGGLALWRGEPLSGVLCDPLLARERPRLAELRLQAVETRIEADLHLGRQADVIVELQQLAAAEPLRERLHRLLMLALYRDGQQASALAAYQAARRVLAEELGAEPGPDLRRLHQQILAGDPGLAGAPAPDPAPAADQVPAGPATPEVRYSLPPDTAAFTGRHAELDRITASIVEAARGSGTVAVRVIGGMPGVGKTALAVHAAHRLRESFPDRQLFVHLRGHTPGQDPVSPETALADLLAAIGVDPRRLPAALADRSALWRDRMAGQRALLVLDNAASSAQVAPLLPGGGCLVLVTSRRHLADLPGAVVPVLLDTLPPGQARQMFTALAPRAAGVPAGAVAELVALAGFLPLAISLLARVHNRHPAWTLADLTAETRASLLHLAAENDSVAAAFELSYRNLSAAEQGFFRRLALHPGTSTDAFGAAALAGVAVPDGARLLDALHGEGLLTETGYRRYGLHDLARRYARDRAAGDPPAVRAAAAGRLLDYYRHAAARAAARLGRQAPAVPAAAAPPAGPVPGPELADGAQALAWIRAERDTLVTCLDSAARAGDHAQVVQLTAAVAELLRRDGPWPDAVIRNAAAAHAARQAGDRAGEAAALHRLGSARRLTGDHPGAVDALIEAFGIFLALGDRLGQADALCSLGDVRRQLGDYPAAATVVRAALVIFSAAGDRRGQAAALAALGDIGRLTGDFPGAATALEQALGHFRVLGDRLGLAAVLANLGNLRRLTGDYQGAGEMLAEALGIQRAAGSQVDQAIALRGLGVQRLLTGDLPGAAVVLAESLHISRALGSRHGEANSLIYLGDLSRLTGDYPAAAGRLRAALRIHREVGSRQGEANALLYLGDFLLLTGDYPAADAALHEALGIFSDLGDLQGEAQALNAAGELHRARGQLGQSARCHFAALDRARAIASPRDEAIALAGLGRSVRAAQRAPDGLGPDGLPGTGLAGLTGDGSAELRAAQLILGRIGAREAAEVAAELAAPVPPGPPLVAVAAAGPARQPAVAV
jgi:DNA-binding SARP family transcriptional activator/tetratricopeptide (TPR) repeat protein